MARIALFLWDKKLVDSAILKNSSILFRQACRAGEIAAIEIYKLLVSQNHDFRGGILLHQACEYGHVGLAKELMSRDLAALNRPDSRGRLPLHWALISDFPQKDLQKIISGTKDINQSDMEGSTPLHLGCQYCSSIAIVDLLIKRGADVNKLDASGNTPLHLALDSDFGSDKAKSLFTKGAAPDIENLSGFTPIIFAVENRLAEIAEILFSLIQDARLAQRKTRLGISLFELACEKEMFDFALKLVKRGANLESLHPIYLGELYWKVGQEEASVAQAYNNSQEQIQTHTTPLHQALSKRNFKDAQKLPLQKYINIKDQRGRLPVHIAAAVGCEASLLKVLIQETRDVTIHDNFNRTPLQYACRSRSSFDLSIFPDRIGDEDLSEWGGGFYDAFRLNALFKIQFPAFWNDREFIDAQKKYKKKIDEKTTTHSYLVYNAIREVVSNEVNENAVVPEFRTLWNVCNDLQEFLSHIQQVAYPIKWKYTDLENESIVTPDIQTLIQQSASLDFRSLQFCMGIGAVKPSDEYSIMAFWRSPGIIQNLPLFEKYQFNPFLPDANKNSSLHWACHYPHNEAVVKWLLERKEDPNLPNKKEKLHCI